MTTASFEQPVQQVQQIRRCRHVRPILCAALALLVSHQQAYSHGLLMHVQTSASGGENLHLPSPFHSSPSVSGCSEMGEPEQSFSSTCFRVDEPLRA
jgi:hypothetical protein